MNPKLNILRTFLLLALWIPLLAPAATFLIEDIRVEGLQRISPGTVFNYLPVKIGQRVEADDTGAIIRALYETGFFSDVGLERRGNELVISVSERPAIGQIVIEGNAALETENLLFALKEIGLAEGRVFNRSVLDKIEQELRRQYFNQGRYGVKVESKVEPLERNRVAVKIDIAEGEIARIKRINIVGNQAFSKDRLLDEFSLGTTNWWSFMSKADRYSRQALGGDLETLRSFYLDRGYINFKVESTQVSITPDKRFIYITINLSEGAVYTIGDIKLAGELAAPKEEIVPLIRLNRGEVFSRKEVVAASDRITGLLGDRGYAFANVNSIPEIDEVNKKVAVTYFVDPGKRVYVRRVNIGGNANTRDEVLRREMRQLESAWFSSEQVRLSRERLQRLGYFEEVNIETPAVAGSTDQVDVNINVVERPAGNLMAGVGFSQSEGFVFNTSISQNNFLGSGKRVSLAFNNSDSNTEYRLAYTNPYYTVDGVSRGFDVRYRSTDFAEDEVADYVTDVASAGMNFGVPINEFDRIRFDLTVSNTDFKPGATASAEVLQFMEDYGDNFLDYSLGMSWTHDSRDSYLFPKRGGLQSFSATATVPGSDLNYYKAAYKNRHYFPLTDFFTLSLNGEVGYGDGYGDNEKLPFFQNYYAGGIRSVRGYKAYSLGPRDSTDDPLGGNMKVVGNLELLFPPPFGGGENTSVRMGAFVDAGNVYDTDIDTFDAGEVRYSSGLALTWVSPIGVLGVTYAEPLNDEYGDETESFQFTFGQTF